MKLLLGFQAEGADVTGSSAEHAMVMYLPSGTEVGLEEMLTAFLEVLES